MRVSVELLKRKISELSEKGRFAQYEDAHGKLIRDEGQIATLQENPYLNGRDMAAQYLGVADGKIVGVISPFVLRIVADNTPYEACACTGQAVDMEYRKSGFAIELNEEMRKFSADGVTVDFNVSYVARRLAKMMGAAVFEAKRFVLVRRSADIVSKKVSGVVGRLISPLADVVFFIHRLWVKMRVGLKSRGWKFVEVKASDEQLIADYSEMIAEDPHRFREDASPAWVKWVLAHDFGPIEMAHKHLYQVNDVKGQRIGYVMTRMTGRRGRVLDWQVADGKEDLLPVMLLKAVLMLEKYSDLLLIAVSAEDKDLCKSLRGYGLPTLPDQVACVGAAEDSPLRKHEGWDVAANWRVRPSMGDSVFY